MGTGHKDCKNSLKLFEETEFNSPEDVGAVFLICTAMKQGNIAIIYQQQFDEDSSQKFRDNHFVTLITQVRGGSKDPAF